MRRLSALRKIVVTGAAVIGLILITTTSIAFHRYRVELAEAARELRTLDLLLAEETGRSLQSVNLVLDSIRDQIATVGIATPDALDRWAVSRGVHDELKTRVAGIPQLDAISIVGANGQLLSFSRYWPIPDVHLGDRDYFEYLRDHADETPFLSEPVSNRGTGAPTIYLARRISDRDGKFMGMILGAIELGYFQRLYDSLHLEPGNIIALWRRDGILLARYPQVPLTNRRVPPDTIVPNAPTYLGVPNVSEKSWTMDGAPPRPRLVAAQVVDGYPLQINIGRRKSLILKDWRREVLASGVFVIVAILSIVAMLWAVARRFSAYEAVATAARERERAILARQEAEEALRQAQKMEAVGQLTGGVAHDFNNLLTVIGSSVELLRRDGVGPDRRARYVEAIADASQRAAKLTAQLLAFARRQALKPEVFDVVADVGGVSQMIDRLTGSRIVVTTDLPDEPCHVMADANQFDTAIVNLAVNGRDAMPDGGHLTIRVRATDEVPATALSPRRVGAFVAISVGDSGVGIPRDLQDRVFEPFFTTKQVGQGTGLGLSQVIGFAQQSGGTVSLSSEVGVGSTFVVHLPRVAAELPTARQKQDVKGIIEGAGARVLVVDDDPQVARLTAQLLKELRYFSITATSGEDALGMLEDDPDGFDAVFSDVVMPGMGGLTLARRVQEQFPGLPVVLTTGFSATLAESGAGGFALLHKPYGLEQLSHTLSAAISNAARDPKPRSTGTAAMQSDDCDSAADLLG